MIGTLVGFVNMLEAMDAGTWKYWAPDGSGAVDYFLWHPVGQFGV